MNAWLLLHYKLPSKPTALRVYIWRKLKRLGAILLNDAVWVLPDISRTAEQLQWLAAEIQERKGNAHLWRSNLVFGDSENALVEQFRRQAEEEYRALLKKLERKNRDLSKLSQEYLQISAKDYFASELGGQIRERLLALRGDEK